MSGAFLQVVSCDWEDVFLVVEIHFLALHDSDGPRENLRGDDQLIEQLFYRPYLLHISTLRGSPF